MISNELDSSQDENRQDNPPTTGASDDLSAQPASTEELFEASERENIGRVVDEILRGRQVASVYIDARSGGVFFGAEAHITGNVIGREHYRTDFRGTTAGPVHTGTENIYTQEEHFSSNESRISSGPVIPDLLEKVRSVYVEPPSYRDAAQILIEKHVIVISGQARCGKWTSALHLLLRRDVEQVLEISPAVEVKDLRAGAWDGNLGYAIDTLGTEEAEKLTVFALSHLSSALKTARSYLVISVDSSVSLPSDISNSYAVRWQNIPDQNELLSKHLDWYITDSNMRQKANELLEETAVQQMLDARLLPGEVDRLAELLARAVRGELKLEEALARFDERAQKQVKEWFERHAALEDRTFMIAVAVLNGSSYNMIVEADEQLQALINPSSGEKGAGQGGDFFFGKTVEQRVEMACARLVEGYEVTEFGHSRVQMIELDNPTFQPAVLAYVWQSYGRLRRLLLAWLEKLGHHSTYDVRVRAAAAVGELSKQDFSYVRRDVLLPWANHQDGRARDTAAFALGIPIWEGTLAPQVMGLLHHWSTLRNNWRLSWTAAASYGGLAGLRFPGTALQDLYHIAQLGDKRLLDALTRSMTNLLETGHFAGDYYLRVLDALVFWTAEDKKSAVNITGLIVFLSLAAHARVRADPDADTWLTLLWLANEDDIQCERITTLWRRTLNEKIIRKRAASVLYQWLAAVEEDDRLRPAIENILRTISTEGTERERERLCFYLRRWTTQYIQKPELINQILVAAGCNSKKETVQ